MHCYIQSKSFDSLLKGELEREEFIRRIRKSCIMVVFALLAVGLSGTVFGVISLFLVGVVK